MYDVIFDRLKQNLEYLIINNKQKWAWPKLVLNQKWAWFAGGSGPITASIPELS